MNKVIGIFVVFLLALFPSVSALDAEHVVSNSEDWKDVYSTLLYASLQGIQGDFLTSAPHGPLLLDALDKGKELGIITSEDTPIIFDYESLAESEGFERVEEIRVDDANLDLLQGELPGINKFIIVDDSFGYNAIAVVPYAVQTNAWVFLASQSNIDDIDAILGARNPESVIIYGFVDSEVQATLESYNPEIISSGDRFEDNIEIVERFLEENQMRQVVLTNGEFIEKELLSGTQPILFTGKENVPDKIKEYLESSDIDVGVLIGNDLINAATNIRRTTGISVMVKFAQSARGESAGISAVEGLDLFPLPTPNLVLEIYSVKYNRATGQIEVTYFSNSNVPLYLKGTLTSIANGIRQETSGDLEAIFLAPGDYKTIVYPGVSLEGDTLSADIFVLFGEVPDSLDRTLQGVFQMDIVNVIDRCSIEIESLAYNKQKDAFFIRAKNIGDVDCHVDIELLDIKIGNNKITLGTEGSILIPSGKTRTIEIAETLSDVDLGKNPFVWIASYYGQREDSLINVISARFDLEIQRYTKTTYALITLAILMLLILFFLIYRRRKEDDW